MSIKKPVYDAWLASAELPGDVLIPMLHELDGSENVYEAFREQNDSLIGMIPPACRKILKENADADRLASLRTKLEQHNIRSLTILENGFPHVLRQIGDPPGILFYQGDPACLQNGRTAAMVGSRAASYEGLKASRKISAELGRSGVTVVSGLAYGIDAACHRGCIDGGGTTVAVMGCGLDQTYPAGNEPLKKEILEKGGLLLSEYVPGSKPLARHFPYRNRIISGLSDVVVLMEARIRSGSMTTVDHALRQGKEVYAYPGDPTSPLSEGNRILLREGARYFSAASELLSDMGWLDKEPHVGQNSGCSAPYLPANEKEEAVYGALAKGALGFDEIIQATGLSPSDLMGTLTVLQMKRAVEALPGKRFQAGRD